MARRTGRTGGRRIETGNNGRAASGGAASGGAAAVLAAACAVVGVLAPSARAEGTPLVASALGARWEGKALRVEGAGPVTCVRYSSTPGGCEVHFALQGKDVEVHKGTCSLGAGRGRGYLELVCRAAAATGQSPDACVPGQGLVVVNMTAGFELSGDEDSVADTTLPRRVSVVGPSCAGSLSASPLSFATTATASEGRPQGGATDAVKGVKTASATRVDSSGAPIAFEGDVVLEAKDLAVPNARPQGAFRDRVAIKLARLETGSVRGDTVVRVAPSSLPEATVTSTLNANWNGRAVEMDTGSVVYCVNFTRAKGSCTAFFKDKATQAVEGPSSGDCSVVSRDSNSVLAFAFLSGKPLRTTVTLRNAVAGHEEAFPGRNGQDFWRLRERPCLSSNF